LREFFFFFFFSSFFIFFPFFIFYWIFLLLLLILVCFSRAVMFHVAPLMNSEQHRRLVGNDITYIFYHDSPQPFNSALLGHFGQVPHAFLVVQPLAERFRYELIAMFSMQDIYCCCLSIFAAFLCCCFVSFVVIVIFFFVCIVCLSSDSQARHCMQRKCEEFCAANLILLFVQGRRYEGPRALTWYAWRYLCIISFQSFLYSFMFMFMFFFFWHFMILSVFNLLAFNANLAAIRSLPMSRLFEIPRLSYIGEIIDYYQSVCLTFSTRIWS
jgi:hypothetical protein